MGTILEVKERETYLFCKKKNNLMRGYRKYKVWKSNKDKERNSVSQENVKM